MDIQVCIPHYFTETHRETGYGSLRKGSRLRRSIALGRCLSSLVNLRRSGKSHELNIRHRGIEERLDSRPFPVELEPDLNIEITICTIGDAYLDDVLSLYGTNITLQKLTPDKPMELGLATRDHLIQERPDADLYVYMEDDLIIGDPLYFDKLSWFHTQTDHRMCLMPHRYEPRVAPNKGKLLVDGPLKESFIRRFTSPQKEAVRGTFMGHEVCFDISDNPHSGSFCLSRSMVQHLRQQQLPRKGFSGPLETAATLTVLQFFPILKPSRQHAAFLEIEHGHTSFLNYFGTLPLLDKLPEQDG